jgi:hypothetical protein
VRGGETSACDAEGEVGMGEFFQGSSRAVF